MFFRIKRKDEVKTSIESFKKIHGMFWKSKLLQIWKDENYSLVPNEIVEGLKKAKDSKINLNSF